MRRVVDVAAILAAGGMIAAMAWAVNARLQTRQHVQQVAAETERFRQTIAYRAAANSADLNMRGWPKTIDPTWFGSEPPQNSLVTPERPWVEVATAEESSLKNPLIRMTVTPFLASFWYNPYQGIVRARVPVTISDRQALDWYNTINGTALDSIYTHDSLSGAPAVEPAEAAKPAPSSAEGAPTVQVTTVQEPAAAPAAEPEGPDLPAAPPKP